MLTKRLLSSLLNRRLASFVLLWGCSWLFSSTLLSALAYSTVFWGGWDRRKQFDYFPQRPAWWLCAIDFVADCLHHHCTSIANLCEMLRLGLSILGQYQWRKADQGAARRSNFFTSLSAPPVATPSAKPAASATPSAKPAASATPSAKPASSATPSASATLSAFSLGEELDAMMARDLGASISSGARDGCCERVDCACTSPLLEGAEHEIAPEAGEAILDALEARDPETETAQCTREVRHLLGRLDDLLHEPVPETPAPETPETQAPRTDDGFSAAAPSESEASAGDEALAGVEAPVQRGAARRRTRTRRE